MENVANLKQVLHKSGGLGNVLLHGQSGAGKSGMLAALTGPLLKEGYPVRRINIPRENAINPYKKIVDQMNYLGMANPNKCPILIIDEWSELPLGFINYIKRLPAGELKFNILAVLPPNSLWATGIERPFLPQWKESRNIV
jgi:GTPase SAR1 family protein